MRFVLLAVVTLFVPALAIAQSLGTSVLNTSGDSVPSLTLNVSPQYPEPGGSVTVTPESTLVDLQDASVTISVNGEQVYSGDAAPVTVSVAGGGAPTVVDATAVVAGQSYSASVTLDPGEVTLVEEPLSTAPELYPGKPLVPEGGSVRLVAVTDFRTSSGQIIPASSLSYTWTEGNSALENSSGIGADTLVIPSPLQYRDEQISVAVQSQDGSISGGDSVTLTASPPTLRLYTVDPLEGILYDHVLSGSLAITNPEISVEAEPYSFSFDDGLPTINWFVNGSSVQTNGTLTLRPTGSGSGSAAVSATVDGANTFFGNADAALSLTFGQSSGGLLGL